jgi:methylated-DNA--[protein]-cysteine S-methyltransferase
MFYSTYYNSPIGKLLLASDGKNLTGLWIEKQKYYADTAPDNIQEQADLPIFIKTREWLDKYFQGKNPAVSELPLAPRGGEFRQAVWKILCQIPQGQVLSYGEIAKMIARQTGKKSMSAQAVGGAVGHNPISIIIPCHRVVGTNGSLTGYAGGLDIKIKLLESEGVDMSRLFRPKKGTAL